MYINPKKPATLLINIVMDILHLIDDMEPEDKLKHCSQVHQMGKLMIDIERANWQNAHMVDYERLSNKELKGMLREGIKLIDSMPPVPEGGRVLKPRSLQWREQQNDKKITKELAALHEAGKDALGVQDAIIEESDDEKK